MLTFGAAGLPPCCRGECALLQSLQEGQAVPDTSLPHLQHVSPYPLDRQPQQPFCLIELAIAPCWLLSLGEG